MNSKPLNVAIDARVNPASAGGVAQVILGLVHALGRLDDSSTRYCIVVSSPPERDFLQPYLGTNQQFAIKTTSLLARAQRRFLGNGPSRPRRLLRHNTNETVPNSESFFKTLNCDVVHFPHQRFQLTGLPSIYNPHDLQHLHFPEFFDPADLAQRDMVYRSGCRLADTVAVSSRWVKEDVVEHYQLEPAKIQIIPWAPPTESYDDPSPDEMEEVRRKYQLVSPFVFYPAMTWPHKNHLRLLEALAISCKTTKVKLHLVCTGSLLEPHATVIKKRVSELGLESQVKFLGFVSTTDLRSIYRLSQFLVMPSLFESDSSPIYEAWIEGTPIACSNVTSLPIQVGDAGVLFDPYEPHAIAEAMIKLATNNNLRQTLSALGKVRVKDYDWDRTAKAYRAVYRRAAGRTLTEEDQSLLSWDWMESPMRVQETRA
jgi:glycosyltransferase involved in cell wall biosynthesis